MLAGSKFSVGFVVCTGLLFLLDQRVNGEESETLTATAEIRSPLANPQPRTSVASFSAETDAPFANIRAALSVAKQKANELESYTSMMELQEEVNGQLKSLSNIKLKLRKQPFSVYMRWEGNGQEALFVNGRNSGRLLAKPPNGLAAIKRLWRLDPESRMAKQGCRYPITASGLENLVNRVHAFYSERDDWTLAVTCCASQAAEAGSDFSIYEMRFMNREFSPVYSTSRLSFEVSSGLLLRVQNYGWTEEPAQRLLEHYVFRSVDSSAELGDRDFDENNSEYEFVAP